MVDISLPILIQPIANPAVPQVGTSPDPGSTTTILPSLMALPTGTMVRGNVVQPRNAQGHVVISTAKGDLALKMDIPIKRGIEVVIRLDKSSDELMAKLISIDGRSVGKYVESIKQELQQDDVITRSQLANETQASGTAKTASSGVIAQSVLKAVLVALPPAPAPSTTATPPTANTVPPQPTLAGNIPLPQAAHPAQLLPSVPTALTTTQIAAQAAPLIVTPQGTQPLQSGAKLQLTIASVTLPEDGTTKPSGALPALPQTVATPPAMLRSAVQAGISAYRNLMGNAMPQPAMPLPQATTSAAPIPTETPPPPTASAPATALPQAAPPSLPTAAPPPPSPSPQPAPPPPSPSPQPAPPPSTAGTATPPPTLPASASAPPTAVATPAAISPLAQPSVTPSPAAPAAATPAPAPPPPAPPVPPSASSSAAPTATPPAPTPPAASTAAPPLPPRVITAENPATMQATVIHSSPAGDLTLHTPVGTVQLFGSTSLPAGTQLTLNVQQIENPQAPVITEKDSTTHTPRFSGLESLAAQLPPPDPSAAYQASPMARAGKEMLADMTFLMAALKGGDLKKWLGERTMHKLSQEGQTELLARLSSEFNVLRQVNSEPKDASGWHHTLLPVHVEGNVEPVRLFHRHHDNDPERDADPSKVMKDSTDHFIVGLQLSHLGEIQLDGFIRKDTPAAKAPPRIHFELVIRSAEALPDAMHQHIRELFAAAQSITGFSGQLSFRSGANACHPLPRSDALLHTHDSVQSLMA